MASDSYFVPAKATGAEAQFEPVLINTELPDHYPPGLDWYDVQPLQDELRHVIEAIKESQGYDPSGGCCREACRGAKASMLLPWCCLGGTDAPTAK